MESRLSLGPPFRSTVPSRCSVLRVIYPRQAIAPSKANVQAVAIRGSGPADKITAPSLNLDLRCERHRALRISCILQWLVGQGLGPLGFCRSRQELQVRPGTEWWKHMRVMPDLGQDLSERCDSCPQEIQLALLSWPASLHVATGQGEVEWYSLAQGCQWSRHGRSLRRRICLFEHSSFCTCRAGEVWNTYGSSAGSGSCSIPIYNKHRRIELAALSASYRIWGQCCV